MSHAKPDFRGEWASSDARYVADWVLDSADNQGLPFAIVDKKDARILVFDAGGQLVGASVALLGSTPGDLSVPGIAARTPASLTPGERTTPAGRFASEPGFNHNGEDIVWFDYDASLAIHRLRPAASHERRAERMASPATDDKRISLGCVVVPVAFYASVVGPVLGSQRGVVYVLPENMPVQAMFAPASLRMAAR